MCNHALSKRGDYVNMSGVSSKMCDAQTEKCTRMQFDSVHEQDIKRTEEREKYRVWRGERERDLSADWAKK